MNEQFAFKTFERCCYALGITVILLVAVSWVAKAEELKPQTLSSAGGLIYITPQFNVAYTGTITFPKNSLTKPVAFTAFGGRSQVGGVSTPPNGKVLFSLTIPSISTPLATTGPTTLKITVPATVSASESLNLYSTTFPQPSIGAAPDPVIWALPIPGSRSEGHATFIIPSFSIPASTVMVFQITQ